METVVIVPDAFRPPYSKVNEDEAVKPPKLASKPIDGQPICLPGYGLSFDNLQEKDVVGEFHHPIEDGLDSALITIRELRMLQFINQITDKPEWEKKVFNPVIINKWRVETKRQIVLRNNARDEFLTDAMFEYCLKELQEKAKAYQDTKVIVVLDVNSRVVKSDVAVSEDTRTKLMEAVKPLEDIPERFKDWHPGSDELVLDLVHPSLFPLIYGVSQVLPHDLVPLDCMKWTGSSDTVPVAILEKQPGFVESRWAMLTDRAGPRSYGNFMWLPSNISLDEAGKAHIDSYINNLHPVHHQDLYRILETIIDATIPLWNEALSQVERKRVIVDNSSDNDYLHPKGIAYPGRVHLDWEMGPFEDELEGQNYANERQKEKKKKEDDDKDQDEDDENNDADPWELEYEYKQWKTAQGVLLWPEPEEFVPTDKLLDRDHIDLLNLGKGLVTPVNELQIIFKLANIHLTPEKPEYSGGSWHIEGALNEYIVASAIYYYDESNITDSHLAFRHVLDEEDLIMIPPQMEYESVATFFGVEQDGENSQDLGQVLTRQGRLLCFPNRLQHCVQPFKLQDVTKPGHRKILAMFLVSPSTPKLSTANVPPQRKDWWAEEVCKIKPFSDLPQELFDNIMDFVDYPLSWERACEVREKLMAERTAISDTNNTSFLTTISFCEH